MIVIDIPISDAPEVDILEYDPPASPLEFYLLDINNEEIITAQNANIAVAYPSDWPGIFGDGNDGE